jgi:hypothetical protein
MFTKSILTAALVIGFGSAAFADQTGCQGSCSAQDMGKPTQFMTWSGEWRGMSRDTRDSYAFADRYQRRHQGWMDTSTSRQRFN